ncbi:hypothetical protein CgunFtcFv8_018403 [Champsocephalus gunnari]|uniref:Uncharacterized protein n=1 Tax=Champsocephalus gunnari TaxID=52237 RepID=A0AAN8GX10_CHAGU|nr:hypothetical protein CgunFtcFv8_018403 [Champsocephalus gunnari]
MAADTRMEGARREELTECTVSWFSCAALRGDVLEREADSELPSRFPYYQMRSIGSPRGLFGEVFIRPSFGALPREVAANTSHTT